MTVQTEVLQPAEATPKYQLRQARSTTHSEFGAKTTASEAAAAFRDQIRDKTGTVADGAQLTLVLITGPSQGGIGYETALAIARQTPALLLLAGRDIVRLGAAAAGIRSEVPDARLRLIELDLSSFASVRAAAKEVKQRIDRLDVLINNAGIMMTPHQLTMDGHESQFATNHLGPWLFTNLLRPILSLSASGRVVFVSSVGHRTSPVFFDDPNFHSRPYSNFLSYAQSKTACVLDALGFTTQGVQAVALHPGGIRTNLGRYLSKEDMKGMIGRFFNDDGSMREDSGWNFKTLEEGASTTIVAAFDPKLEGGEYLDNCQVAPVVGAATDMEELMKGGVAEHAIDKESAERLWTLTGKMIGETF